jgi:hypothetical protein
MALAGLRELRISYANDCACSGNAIKIDRFQQVRQIYRHLRELCDVCGTANQPKNAVDVRAMCAPTALRTSTDALLVSVRVKVGLPQMSESLPLSSR